MGRALTTEELMGITRESVELALKKAAEKGVVDTLARLPEKTLVDESSLAAALKVTSRTVRRMVTRFELPPPVQLGGRSVWMVGKVLQHIESALERAEREALK